MTYFRPITECLRANVSVSSLPWLAGSCTKQWPWRLTLTCEKLTVTSGTHDEHLCRISWKSHSYFWRKHSQGNEPPNHEPTNTRDHNTSRGRWWQTDCKVQIGLFQLRSTFINCAILCSGVDPNLFWGGEIFTLTRRGTKLPEARRSESGGGVLGGGSPPARGLGERCKLRQRGPGRSPGKGKFEIWWNLRPQNSLQKCLITCKLLQKG